MIAEEFDQAGFTFIELILAVALLATASTIIVGVQGASIGRAMRDRNAITATTIARQIMAVVETKDTKLDVGEQAGPALDVMANFGIEAPSGDEARKIYDRFSARLVIEDQSVPILKKADKEVLRKMGLSIEWGEAPEDRMEIVYYVPIDPL